ncbi:MAG: sarcosine oxidase subunit gamma family protein [Hyphomicrobiaceae bacterium]
MAESAWQRRTVLAGIAHPGRFGMATAHPGVVARMIEPIAIYSISARRGEIAETVACLSDNLGAPVVDGPKRLASGGISVSGVGPGQWVAIGREGCQSTIALLQTALTGKASVVDQTDSRFILELSGDRVRCALAKGIPVDLHPSVFGPGDVAQTIAGHIHVQLASMTEHQAYELVTSASTAVSLWTWMTSSAAEFGLEVL